MKAFVIHAKDPGRVRERQEDHCTSYTNDKGAVLIISDGMGGHAGGNLASEAAVGQASHMLNHWLETGKISSEAATEPAPRRSTRAERPDATEEIPITLQEWIHTESSAAEVPDLNIPDRSQIRTLIEATYMRAQAAVYELAVRNPLQAGNAGCTLTLALVRDNWMHIAHIGDSRAYLLRGQNLEQLTVDHSGAMLLVAAGIITPEAARHHPESHRLYRFLGIDATELSVDLYHEPAEDGDILLLCSDGLWSMVDDQKLAELLFNHTDLKQAADALMALANENGGEDNISLALAQIRLDSR